jgi:hypothetical protein
MKLRILFLTIMVALFLSSAFAENLSYGISKGSVKDILGEPDMVTTRDRLQAQIHSIGLDRARYADAFEFWVYYQYPGGDKRWGFAEFNRDGELIDFLINMPGQESRPSLEMLSPGSDIFKKIGYYSGDDWNLMPDKSKTLLIIEIMDNLRGKEIFIRRHPFYYLEELDSFFKEDGRSHFTVINTFYTFALLNRDWDDGLDKDERIKRVLPADIWSDFIK